MIYPYIDNNYFMFYPPIPGNCSKPPTLYSILESIVNYGKDDKTKIKDLAKVGRFKFNEKLGLANRIAGRIAFSDIVDPETGEIFVSADEQISEDVAEAIQNSGINIVDLKEIIMPQKTLQLLLLITKKLKMSKLVTKAITQIIILIIIIII